MRKYLSRLTSEISIRSTSIMFLPAESTYKGIPSTSGEKDFRNPYLTGFLHSRPDSAFHDDPDRMVSRKESDITLDAYHHPAKRRDSRTPYIQAFDVYS